MSVTEKLDYATEKFRGFATVVSTLGLAAIFLIFIYGIGMRHIFDQPQTWVDEVVTILATWLVFWTGAFVLKWSEFISFDVVFILLPPRHQRWLVVAGSMLFVVVIGYIAYGTLDFILFMKIYTTDMLRISLNKVYSIFFVFLVAIVVRLAWFSLRLIVGDWQRALGDLDSFKKDPEQ